MREEIQRRRTFAIISRPGIDGALGVSFPRAAQFAAQTEQTETD